ncbi:MarR family winged helix-turn-helix transcriptional regulator [Oceanicola sp. S124]|uniref:MarR family winged helix-turn-helix transcriptional regulator n=1 Tax=Oceanicola sp. S124 TaxID=1042378 RepID=UPI0002559386|nr:MarR family transcriptional regulator [Oceanicola sp. S124]
MDRTEDNKTGDCEGPHAVAASTAAGPQAAVVELGPLSREVVFLVRNLHALLRPEGQKMREAMAVESGSIGVLALIWINPGVSQNDLAASLALKKSAVARTVKALEAEGLVARRRASADRRANALTLTEAGHEKMAIFRPLSAALHERLFDGVPGEDRETFLRVLAGLVERLSRGAQD